MPKAYSMDFRQAVARARDGGDSAAEVADTFGCSPSWVRKLLGRRAATGGLEPGSSARPDDQRRYDDADEAAVRKPIAAKPDATLAEVGAAVDKPAGRTTVWRTLERLGLTRKKSRRTRPSRAAPTS